MPLTRENWPIAAGLLQFSNVTADGRPVAEAPDQWSTDLAEVADAGFDNVEIGDVWVRTGDLDTVRLTELRRVAAERGLSIPSVAVIRNSVIDPDHGEDNLVYGHRTVDAAAELGASVVSFGLHRALTEEQRQQLWFWTVDGARDPVGDQHTWDLAVSRLRELGKHAADVGLALSLEMYEDTYVGTADSAVRLVTDIGLDNVGINPDIGNLVRLHRPVEDWREIVRKTAPYVNYWHVKNYFRDEDPASGGVVTMPAPLESGFVNYRHAVRDVITAGFRGVFCCEHYGGDGLSVSATNAAYLRRILPRSVE